MTMQGMRARVAAGAVGVVLAVPAVAAAQPGAAKPAVEAQLGYLRLHEIDAERQHGAFATLVFVKDGPVALVVKAAGTDRSDDSRHFSGTTPVEVDGDERTLLAAAGGRLEARPGSGRIVPFAQVLAGVMYRQERSTTRMADVIVTRNRASAAIYGEAGAGVTVYVTPRVGLHGGAALTAVLGGFGRELYGYVFTGGLSVAFGRR